ncbi:MAG: phospholipid carrier-dependent glycosyltransferase [Planctomycetota bacterium]
MPAGLELKPRSIKRDLIALTAFCAVVYALGLTTHGLTNWQESQRVLVARDMQQAGEWIVPTVHGVPYLAKPPIIYWCQITLANTLGRDVGVFELRLTVALGGWLGVVLTYLAARSLLRPRDNELDPSPRNFADHAAWWSALMLATGVLYVRSSRIGELDILLVAPTVLAIWGLWIAWRRHIEARQASVLGLSMASVGTVLAVLVKGPPPLLAIMLSLYPAIHYWYGRTEHQPRRTPWLIAAGLAIVAAGVGVFIAREPGAKFDEWFGVAFFALAAGAIVYAFAPGFTPKPFVGVLKAWTRTHPVSVPLLGFAALWGWGKLAELRIGAAAVDAAAGREADDNLRLLIPGSPLNNLEAAAFGVGAGSILAIVAAIWLIKDWKPTLQRHGPGLLVVVCWAALGLLAFSALGKGVPRYLTPLWPAIAMLGGVWLASALRDFAWAKPLRAIMTIVIAALAIGQAAWYGYVRERLYADRSPRAFVQDLQRPELAINPDRLGGLDLWNPALDFYVAQHAERWHDDGPHAAPPGVVSRPLAELRRDASDPTQPYTLLYSRPVGVPLEQDAKRTKLLELGFAVQTIPTDAAWLVEHRREEVVAVHVWAVSSDGRAAPTP